VIAPAPQKVGRADAGKPGLRAKCGALTCPGPRKSEKISVPAESVRMYNWTPNANSVPVTKHPCALARKRPCPSTASGGGDAGVESLALMRHVSRRQRRVSAVKLQLMCCEGTGMERARANPRSRSTGENVGAAA